MNFPVLYTSEQMERIQNFINETFGGGEEGFIGHELKSEYLRRYARQQEGGRCAGTRCQHDQRKVLCRNAATEPVKQSYRKIKKWRKQL